MAKQHTLSIVKPDAFAAGHLGAILAHFETAGLRVVAGRVTQLTRAEAEGFYAEHSERPFFGELVTFMCSGPLFLAVLEGEDAIVHYRNVIGATDPADADEGTVRKLYGIDRGRNAVHGSDAPASAQREIAHFFAGVDIFSTGD